MAQRNINGERYVKNYQFDFAFGGAWGNCSVTMTSVIGHITGLEFEPRYKNWEGCDPRVLFDAPIHVAVDPVWSPKFNGSES